MTSLINPETLSLSSFLLNHSKEYGVAAAASLIEFFIEVYFFPGMFVDCIARLSLKSN